MVVQKYIGSNPEYLRVTSEYNIEYLLVKIEPRTLRKELYHWTYRVDYFYQGYRSRNTANIVNNHRLCLSNGFFFLQIMNMKGELNETLIDGRN